MKQDEDIRITGVIAEEVSQPRNDGTRGSGLYAVPFRLSQSPDSTWADLFVNNWDRPPQWTSMHRPGIARVYGSKVVLDGTTMEEVERYHRDTLKLVVDETNRQWRELKGHADAGEERRRAQEAEHRRNVEDISERISFD